MNHPVPAPDTAMREREAPPAPDTPNLGRSRVMVKRYVAERKRAEPPVNPPLWKVALVSVAVAPPMTLATLLVVEYWPW